MCSFISTMFLGVEIGLAISIGLALMIVIYESAFPHTALLGRVGRTTIYRNVKQFPDSQVLPSRVNHGIDRHVGKAGQLLQVHISCPSDDVGVLWTATPYAFDFAHVQGISDTLIHKISFVALQVIPGIAACRVDAAMYFASELLSGCVAPFSYAHEPRTSWRLHTCTAGHARTYASHLQLRHENRPCSVSPEQIRQSAHCSTPCRKGLNPLLLQLQTWRTSTTGCASTCPVLRRTVKQQAPSCSMCCWT